jgi:hypothetical protein
MPRSAFLVLIALLPPLLAAARLLLQDGTVINGDFISGTPDTLIFRDHNGVRRRFPVNQVRDIDFAASSRDAAGSAEAPAPGAGRYVTVRPDARIDGSDTASGAHFLATVSEDVTDESGKVIIPRGSRATLVIRNAAGGYVLDLDSVRVNGRSYTLDATVPCSAAKGPEIQFRLEQPLHLPESTRP